MPPAIPPTPPALRSVEAAVAVVRDYYHALAARDYRRAYALWHGRRGYAAFARGYARTRDVTVRFVPPFATEGGAGSIYAEIRVRVAARRDDGRAQRFAGSYTLRRVDDVDGSSAAQRHWHIVAAKLVPLAR